MKKTTILFLTMLLIPVLGIAQRSVKLCIEYDKVVNEKGELYQYSERYLGTNQVITKNETTYILRSIKVLDNDSTKNTRNHQPRSRHERKEQTCLQVPLNEETLMATNTAKKAEGVAKQIYRIREARLTLVSGEAEHTPNDGQAIRLMLNELNRQETELTSLFVGTSNATRHTQIVNYTLSEDTTTTINSILLRFSRYSGPVAADDLSGEPVYIEQTNKIGERPSTKPKHKKNETENFVESSSVAVRYEGKNILNPTPVYQYVYE